MNDRFVNPADEFAEILQIIRTGRARVFEVANLALMETYWLVGGFLSRKVAQAGWGKGVVQELAGWLGAKAPEAKGFSAQNLWRMKQFSETFSADPKLSAPPRVLSYFKREVLPHAADGWVDEEKNRVGYEIPFKRHFHGFQASRSLTELDEKRKQFTGPILNRIGGLLK